MDLYGIIDELISERNRIQRIIESLEAMDPAREESAGRRRKAAGARPRPRKLPADRHEQTRAGASGAA